MTMRLAMRNLACGTCGAALMAAFPFAAGAQLVSTVPGVQTRIAADQNGVDLVTGAFTLRHVDLDFGPNAGTRLNVATELGSGDGDNYSGYVYERTEGGANYLYVVHGSETEKFLVSGGGYISVSGDGTTMAHTNGNETYLMTERDGTKVNFVHKHYNNNAGLYQGSGYIDYIGYVEYIDGERLTPSVEIAWSQWCENSDEPEATGPDQFSRSDRENATNGSPVASQEAATATKGGRAQPNRPPSNIHCYSYPWRRVQSVTSNLGFQMRFTYQSETVPASSNPPDYDGFVTAASVTAVNLAVDGCDPAASSCAYSRSWPKLTYTARSSGGQFANTAYTDPLGRQWAVSSSSNGATNQISIRRPSSATPYVVATLVGTYPDYMVSSVQTPDGTWSYAHTDAGDSRTMTVTDPLGRTRTVVSQRSTGLIASDTNALSQTKSYTYDAYGRVLVATLPEQNSEAYDYDQRGNVIRLTRHAKPGSNQPDVVTTSVYPATCASLANCNKPLTSTDALTRVTQFDWDPTHGGLLSVTAPAVNGVQPQVRNTYAALQAWYKDAGGTLAASGLPVYRLVQTSACATQVSCAGTADETRTTIAYGAAGVANNLLATAVTRGSGDGSVSATTTAGYDADANLVSVDGPLPGADDTSVLRWDAGRRLVGTIAPDPDGSGPRARRAVRLGYHVDGMVTTSETGTVTGTSDAAWSAFAPAQVVTAAYDASDRRTSDTLTAGGSAGGTTYARTDYGYGAMGRPETTTVRLFGSGEDRTTRTAYDELGRVSAVTSAEGTAAASSERATYRANGQVATVTDGENNLTTYGYDGFDRLAATLYPAAAPGANASNAGDSEQLGYDANGNVTSRLLRDGQSIAYGYDALGRVTSEGRNHTFAWDNMGRLTRANDLDTNAYEDFGWDALGRKTSEGSLLGGVRTMAYDAAGRRTRLTWPDGFYVTYDYDTTGAMTAIRENGAAALATFGYDDLGRRTSLVRANGTSTGYGYDAVSRLTGLTLGGGNATNAYTYGYNAAGQITTRTSANDAFAWTGAVNVDRAYAANGLNRYTQSGSVTPTYDGRGNLTSAGGASYGYDLANRLTGFTGGYIYRNALGQWLDVNTEQQWMVYDDDRTIEEFGYEGTVKRRYVYGPGDDEPLVWYEGSGTSDRRWLHADERGSIVAVTNDAGSALAINTYDEHGIPGANNLGRFQYTGQRWIAALGLYDYKARMYAPTLGRFLQTDPIGYGDGMNAYNYAGSDPVNFTDPTGLLQTSGDITVTACAYGLSSLFENGNLVGCFSGGGGGGFGNGFGGTGETPCTPFGRGGTLVCPIDPNVADQLPPDPITQGTEPTYLTPLRCGAVGELLLQPAGDGLIQVGGGLVAVGGTGAAVGTGLGVFGALTGNIPAAGLGTLTASLSAPVAEGGALMQGAGAVIGFVGGESSRQLVKNASAAIINRLPLPGWASTPLKFTAKKLSNYVPDVRTCHASQ